METAEKQVTDVVKVDIHLDYTPDGKRFIHRISEITQLEEGIPYPDYNENDPVNSMNEITAEYYKRKTDRVGFTTHTVLEYDVATHTYKTTNRFSKYLEDRIKASLGPELSVVFDEFILREWGPRVEEGVDTMSQSQIEDKLTELQNKVDEINNRYAQADANSFTPMTDASSGAEIEEAAADMNVWKDGYSGGTREATDFELGDFFSDDDYN